MGRPHAPFEGKVDMLEVLEYFCVDRPHAPFEGKVDMLEVLQSTSVWTGPTPPSRGKWTC